MDGSRPPALDHANHANATAFAASGAHRCGWCGLLPLPEDRALVVAKQLCHVCFGILGHVDWRHLLNRRAAQA